MNKKIFRHGDVVIKGVSEIPDKARETKNNVLAEGEVTGHRHIIRGEQLQIFADAGRKFLNVQKTATITHEEHKPIELYKGKYEVVIQREYNPVVERKVMD